MGALFERRALSYCIVLLSAPRRFRSVHEVQFVMPTWRGMARPLTNSRDFSCKRRFQKKSPNASSFIRCMCVYESEMVW